MAAFMLLSALGGPAALAVAPEGWTSELLHDFDAPQPSVRAAADTPPDLNSALSTTPDAKVSGRSLMWRLQAASGPAVAALVLAENHPGFDGLSLWVKNPYLHEVTMAIVVTDAAGRDFTVPAAAVDDTKEWRRLFFNLSEAVAEHGDLPRRPLRQVRLSVSGIAEGVAYTLFVDELYVHQAPMPVVRVTRLEIPAEVRPGERVQVRAGAQVQGLGSGWRLELALQRENITGMLATLQPVGGTSAAAEVELEGELIVPLNLRGGTYRAVLTGRGADCTAVPEQVIELAADPAPRRQVDCLMPHQGGTFVVNGIPLSPVGGLHGTEGGEAGASWVMFHATSDYDPTGRAATVWTAADTWDYTALDRRAAEILAASPGAFLVPVVHVSSPPWWDQANPVELMVFGGGRRELPYAPGRAKTTFASWASRAWREQARENLERFVRHVENAPYGPAVIGYQIASGERGAWIYPGSEQGFLGDYHPAQQEAFSNWLQQRYQDVAILRTAWGQPFQPVTTPQALAENPVILGWGQAKIAPQERRLKQFGGVLHDPSVAQDIVDYQLFAAEAVVEVIADLAATVKQAGGGNKLIGTAYGHVFDLAASPYGLQNGGHLAIHSLLGVRDIDFVVAPAMTDRDTGVPLARVVHSSLAAHGKLCVYAGEPADTGALGAVLATGGMAAVRQELPAQHGAFFESLATARRSGVSEVALVVDDMSCAYLACSQVFTRTLLAGQRLGLALMGAPVDTWLLDDVLSGRAAGYKLYIFPNAFFVDEQTRTGLREFLAQERATALWIYGAGGMEHILSGRNIKDLTGMTIIQLRDEGPLQLELPEYGARFGISEKISPRFVCVDDRADVRGTLVGTNFGGLASKSQGEWNSVWSGIPGLPAGLLRDIGEKAGVHVYSKDSNGVFINSSLMAVRAAADGPLAVHFPTQRRLQDIDGKIIETDDRGRLTVDMRAGEMRLFLFPDAPGR